MTRRRTQSVECVTRQSKCILLNIFQSRPVAVGPGGATMTQAEASLNQFEGNQRQIGAVSIGILGYGESEKNADTLVRRISVILWDIVEPEWIALLPGYPDPFSLSVEEARTRTANFLHHKWQRPTEFITIKASIRLGIEHLRPTGSNRGFGLILGLYQGDIRIGILQFKIGGWSFGDDRLVDLLIRETTAFWSWQL